MSDVNWSLRNIYLYTVCLITLIMIIVGAAGTVHALVEFAYPDPGEYIAKPIKGDVKIDDPEEQDRIQRAQSTRQSALSLAGNLALVVIAGPLYAYHWRKIEGELDVVEGSSTPAATV